MSVNKAIVVGNLGRDPEVRALPSGQNVATFSVATTARFNNRHGGLKPLTRIGRPTLEALAAATQRAANYILGRGPRHS